MAADLLEGAQASGELPPGTLLRDSSGPRSSTETIGLLGGGLLLQSLGNSTLGDTGSTVADVRPTEKFLAEDGEPLCACMRSGRLWGLVRSEG